MNLNEAVIATLTYHDLFEYPLTLSQIYQFLVYKKTSIEKVKKSLEILKNQKRIEESKNLYFLKGHKFQLTVLNRRQKDSKSSLERAFFYAMLLSLAPTIKFVGISGALAMQNSDKDDDIDLVIISQKNKLYTARFFANLVLFPFKRNPNTKKFARRACLNLFIDESNLKIEPQNIYMAHEIVQMRPLWDRDETYSRCLKANRWVSQYLPNWTAGFKQAPHSKLQKKHSAVSSKHSAVEILLKKFQLAYMRSKITTERIGDTQLFFHPRDTEKSIMTEYKKRLNRLKIVNS